MKNIISFYYAMSMATFLSLSLFFFANKSNQSINWIFPYFSGAANFETLFDWKISPSDFERVKSLSPNDYRHYKHQRTEGTIINTVNNYGYVLVALASQKLFPFLGDLHGVIFLQVIIHWLLSLILVLFVFTTHFQRISFIFLYVLNPAIIHIVSFPFYYFWLVLPSFFFCILILKKNWRKNILFISIPFLLFSILIRPTPVFLTLLYFIISFFYLNKIKERLIVVAMFIAFSVSIAFLGKISSGSPWHTIYIGIGAYPNNVGVVGLSDEQGYNYFYQKTGIIIDTDVILGNYKNPILRKKYMNTLKDRYFEIAKQKPGLLIRNAILNLFQVFSIGHIINNKILTYLSIFSGFIFLVIMLYARQGIWALAILASAIGFVPYFPPIPQYNFAAYMLLIVAGIIVLERILIKFNYRHSNTFFKNMYQKIR